MEGVTGECKKGEKRGVDKVGAGQRNVTEPCRMLWNVTEHCGTSWNSMESYGMLWNGTEFDGNLPPFVFSVM